MNDIFQSGILYTHYNTSYYTYIIISLLCVSHVEPLPRDSHLPVCVPKNNNCIVIITACQQLIRRTVPGGEGGALAGVG